MLVTETLAGDDRMVGVVRCDVALDAIPWSRASGSTTARWHGTGDGGGIWAQQVSHASLADRDEAAARLAALACAAPAAMVCLVGEEHLWVKAGYGLRAMSSHPPRANSPCSDTVALESTLVVEDAASDEAYTDSLFVLGGTANKILELSVPSRRSCAGATRASGCAEALSARNLPAHSPCVEVTESVPLERGGAAAALRALGVGIALDDDGAGTPASVPFGWVPPNWSPRNEGSPGRPAQVDSSRPRGCTWLTGWLTESWRKPRGGAVASRTSSSSRRE